VHIPRFLAVALTAGFVLMLLFAVAVGAQEESTGTEATGEQAVEVQQQQVQQDEQIQAQRVAAQAVSCPGAQRERVVQNPTRRHESRPDIAGGAVRITYEIFTEPADPDDEIFFELRDKDGDAIVSERVDDDTNGPQEIRVSTDPGKHEFIVEADAGVQYRVELEDCTNVEARNSGGDGSGGGGGGGGGGTGDGTSDGTGTTDTSDTTGTNTTNTNTASPAADATTANANLNANTNRPDSGSFRCDLFLRTVRDDTGALRAQYRGDEQIVQRFEQCLSENVLADTIPNRNLPFTGGMSPLFLGAIGLAAIVAGGAVLRAVMRRAG
jgi:hypothetical protein